MYDCFSTCWTSYLPAIKARENEPESLELFFLQLKIEHTGFYGAREELLPG